MGNLNCTISGRSSMPAITTEALTNNKLTGHTSNNREVSFQNAVKSFIKPSDESLSSNSDVSSNSQTLASISPSSVANATNTIQQESTPNPVLYSKLVAKLPRNSDFKLKKFTDNKDRIPREYLKQNQEQLIKAFNAAISQDPEVRSGHISIDCNFQDTEGFPELKGKPVLTFEGGIIKHLEVMTDFDSIKDKFRYKTVSQINKITQHFDLSDALTQSKNSADIIINMRLAVTFIILSAKINASAKFFNIDVISPFTRSYKERPLEDFFTPNMKSFLPTEIIRAAQAEIHKGFVGRDVPTGFGWYSAPIDNPRKINYV